MRVCIVVIVLLGFTKIGGRAQQAALRFNEAVLKKAIDDFASTSCPALLRDSRARDKLMSDMEDLTTYVNSSSVNLLIDRPKFCDTNVPTLKRKYAITIDDVMLCLKDETKYMNGFVKSMLNGLLDFMCNNDARNIDELLSYGAQSCFRDIQMHRKFPEFQKCLPHPQESGEGMIKPKDELCRDLGVMETCVGGLFDEYCAHWEEHERINTELFEGIMRPCHRIHSGASIHSFSAIFFIFTIFHKMLF